MKRKLFKLALVLVAISGGAIINVVVAWGCPMILFRPIYDGFGGYVSERSMTDHEAVALMSPWFGETIPPASDIYSRQCERLGWRIECGGWSPASQPSHGDWVFLDINHTLAGWPLKSLHGFLLYDSSERDGSQYKHCGAIPIPESLQSGPFEMLPATPLLPGFAINTIFYAAILWALFALPFAIRRRRRIKRGLCPACAYPVGVSPTCTECGATVQRAMIAFSPQRGAGM